ncbi:paralemmin-3 isoform X2 [Osmerus mordax]|uniref:paralemmin-3 isoform X2 n=1 Tax=Osmerus mordax TaxID=8014 RepID=UPI0035104FF8
MDETDKYQQRLQAIAEKRRLQEEEERAKREMEEEKLRLQQLKRKSLRDQWLMEGPPQSPTSPDSQAPLSPLWGSQAKEIEQRIDKLQTESQRLAEKEEKIKEQMEDGQTEAAAVAECVAEAVQVTVVENGQVQVEAASGEAASGEAASGEAASGEAASGEAASGEAASVLEVAEEGVVKNPGPLLEGATALTNGRGEGEGQAALNPSGEEGSPSTNGLVANGADGAVTMTFLGYSEAEPEQDPLNGGEEDEGIIMMRAERVIVTDESDEAPEGLSPPDGAPQSSSQSAEEGAGETEVVEPESVPEPSAEREKVEEEKEGGAEEGGTTVEAETPEAADGEVEMGGEGEAKEVQKSMDAAATPELQSPANALDGAVADIPVSSDTQPALAHTSSPDAEEVAAKTEGENQGDQGGEAVPAAQAEVTLTGQEFQEVSLAEPRTEAGSVEQEPLLSASKAPQTQAGAQAAMASPPETLALSRAQEGESPKRKTCQCCSVM